MIIAVISKKGGVGKTTTSVSLAAALAAAGKRTLVVDLDANAGASLSLGLARDELSPSSADLLLRDQPAAALVRETSVPDLFLLSASVDLRSLEAGLSLLSRKETVLRRALEPIRQDYDYVFLDCPASIDLATRNALAAADRFLIPVVPQFLASEGLEHLIATAERIGLRGGQRTTLLGIVLTIVDYRLQTTRRVVDEVRERFGRRVLAVEVRTNVSLAEAPALGQTIFQYKPYATGAKAYKLLAEEVLDLETPRPAVETEAPAERWSRVYSEPLAVNR